MGGASLLKIHSDSLFSLFSSVFPEHEWVSWKFKYNKFPPNYWTSVNNQKSLVEWTGKELKIKEMSDWYNVSNEVIIKPFKLCFLLC